MNPAIDSRIEEDTSLSDVTFSLTHTLREAARHGERAVLLPGMSVEIRIRTR